MNIDISSKILIYFFRCIIFHPSSGMASLVEYSSRIAGRQERLSTKIESSITDIMVESSHLTKKMGSNQKRSLLVTRDIVLQAIDRYNFRNSLWEEKMREYIYDGVILLSIQGKYCPEISYAVIS